ncbi:AAA family ATPase [Vibrio lentus]|uniref:ATPase AAA-type core domain-containing protein n=1 Tax=Vibrio lentus TaxID=136468 RepID=A0A855IVH2_9VIBR|nr:ATP-binding protein [Vibrio lentus]PMM61274.1 hypothetical protein BCT50_20850 [Vibrio lentus]
MILKLSIKNFYSFKEKVVIDFRSNESELGVAKVAAFSGLNGAGKTNVLRAIQNVSLITDDSSSISKNEKTLDVDGYFYNEYPSEFEFLLTMNGYKYEYSLHSYDSKVLYESLSLISDDRTIVIFERVNGELEQLHNDYYELKHTKPKLSFSLLSIKDLYDFDEDMEHIDNVRYFFKNIIINVGPKGYIDLSIDEVLHDATKHYLKNSSTTTILEAMIKVVDNSIKGVEIETMKSTSGEDVIFPLFKHEVNGKEHYLPLHKESSGVRKMYVLTDLIINSLQRQGLLIIDELDSHLHHLSIKMIVELYSTKENTGGQLLFTAHSSDVLSLVDPDFLYKFEKNNNATSLV